MAAPSASALLLEYDAGRGTRQVPMQRDERGRWSVVVADAGPGTRYAFRADGPFDPATGHRFNPAKLLLDPGALAIDGPVVWREELTGSVVEALTGAESPDPRDTAGLLPRSVVVDRAFDWGGDRRPCTPWRDTVIYECHVKGLTAQHPAVPAEHRGTYLGLSHPAVTAYLRDLGVTAVELLPVHHVGIDRHLASRGLPNYWGYSTIGFFAPDARFATGSDGRQVREFKAMVRGLHAAGLEVILDVVYNHTSEGDAAGMQVSLRGLGNAEYYRLDPQDRGRYLDTTGCGHTVRGDGLALELILGSLRYWADEMHVDGFRFDLLPAICRDESGLVRRDAPLLQAIAADPVLAACKIIAEPWDLGPQGYRLGHFPAPIAEWNGRTRDTIRRFWRGDAGCAADFATRLAGSSDLFDALRSPLASVNYVACHDGFTLTDLVTYAHKHNEANLEGNADGSWDSGSGNFGVEGPSPDPAITAEREAAARAMLASALLALGVPMLQQGDERCRTQLGNNNAYCHDSVLTWVDWAPSPLADDRTRFVRDVLAVRRATPALRMGVHWAIEGQAAPTWFNAGGTAMEPEEWAEADRHLVSVLLPGTGERDSVWLVGWSGAGEAEIAVPEGNWDVVLATQPGVVLGGNVLVLPSKTLVVARPAGPRTPGRG